MTPRKLLENKLLEKVQKEENRLYLIKKNNSKRSMNITTGMLAKLTKENKSFKSDMKSMSRDLF